MIRQVLILIAILFFCLSCSNAQRSIVNEGNTVTFNHYVTFSQKGSRSEAQHGFLKINGTAVPDIFVIIVHEKNAYRFYQRKHMWGRDGYFPVKAPELKGLGKSITKGDIKRGWYRGSVRFKGTPPRWLYVEWRGGAAFVAPESINEMGKAMGLKKIKRNISIEMAPVK